MFISWRTPHNFVVPCPFGPRHTAPGFRRALLSLSWCPGRSNSPCVAVACLRPVTPVQREKPRMAHPHKPPKQPWIRPWLHDKAPLACGHRFQKKWLKKPSCTGRNATATTLGAEIAKFLAWRLHGKLGLHLEYSLDEDDKHTAVTALQRAFRQYVTHRLQVPFTGTKVVTEVQNGP